MKIQHIAIILLTIFCLLIFSAAGHTLEVGDQAPPFTARSNQGELSLADYAGKQHVVLALYFAAFSPV